MIANHLDLMIVDDTFPLQGSAFRIAEFSFLLNHFPRSRVFSWHQDLPKTTYAFEQKNPRLKARTRPWSTASAFTASHLYAVFINNIFHCLPFITQRQIPFSFTLYPGGGFHLDEPECLKKMQAVFSSPMFRSVMVTQNIAYRYLLARRLCPARRIHYQFGGVSPQLQAVSARRFPAEKDNIDVCFVACKYDPKGLDKGWDTFVGLIGKLGRDPRYRFHVVGDFGPDDHDNTAMADQVSYYGHQPTSFFPAFYGRMDFIVSPARAGGYAPGRFDGFPTGCCVEAGQCGVIVVTTDQLRMNSSFGAEEMVIVNNDAGQISDRLRGIIDAADEKSRRHQKTAAAFQRIYDIESQMRPRIQCLESHIAGRPFHRPLQAGLLRACAAGAAP